ncbi:hypothetical protein IGI04_009656 [Brassica rapa subsp. trilocularis]|uniref:Uncharacterized protein n=1 Tax=Brassica rapa subsp. trilocularis TaxID=1813537 RepID=A0ABQ7MY27_BRACM|nr:hypothetical protein IGI04_009656 [Brassica rapa subsp. trilocularis]
MVGSFPIQLSRCSGSCLWEAVDPLSLSSPALGLREGVASIAPFFAGFSPEYSGSSPSSSLFESSKMEAGLFDRRFIDFASSSTVFCRVSSLAPEEEV